MFFITDKGTDIDFETVKYYLSEHTKEKARFKKLHDYYCGVHAILNRKKENGPNERIICNHAKEIADTACGYFIGNPITYSGDETTQIVRDWFKMADIESVDMELAKIAGICGKGYELVCMSDDDITIPKSYALPPENAFIIEDDTIRHNPLFGVYYYPIIHKGKFIGYTVNVYTKDKNIVYRTDTNFESENVTSVSTHPFGEVPIIEYKNNDERQGDFEQSISLIDAYNVLMSDRVNDKEQFVDSILLLINATLGDTTEEAKATKEKLIEAKLLELPSESDAKYLTRTFDESGIEILRKALEEDIHKFSNVPCLTDENFAGNSSGVAMEYKLLGLEMITKIKENNFKKGIKRRSRIYGRISEIKGGGKTGEIEATFSRGLPKNLVEVSNIVSQLNGIVPDKILLSLLPFIKDPEAAIKLLAEQKEENAKAQNAAFGMEYNTPISDEDEE